MVKNEAKLKALTILIRFFENWNKRITKRNLNPNSKTLTIKLYFILCSPPKAVFKYSKNPIEKTRGAEYFNRISNSGWPTRTLIVLEPKKIKSAKRVLITSLSLKLFIITFFNSSVLLYCAINFPEALIPKFEIKKIPEIIANKKDHKPKSSTPSTLARNILSAINKTNDIPFAA